jgi:hypothetical protein
VTASKQSVKLLVGPLASWLRDGGDPWSVNFAYWDTRRDLMDLGETFDGPPGTLLSNIDTAMDSFSPLTPNGAPTRLMRRTFVAN